MLSNSVLQKEDADKVAVNYVPRKFPTVVSDTASEFHRFQSGEERTDFQIDRLVANQTGISELERLSIEEKVEIRALQRIKEIQEEAYQMAYKIGLEEGQQKAYKECSDRFSQDLEKFESVIQAIANLKSDLISFNEAHIVKLAFVMASEIVRTEIKTEPQLVLHTIKQAIEASQAEENVTVKISPEDIAFLNEMKLSVGKEFEFLRTITIEESAAVNQGGCIIETNYGVVDANIEQKLVKLWETIASKVPRVKTQVGSDT